MRKNPRSPGDRITFGAVYTPRILADWVASQLVRFSTAGPFRILDPACGDGQLLASVQQSLGKPAALFGIDVSSVAITEAKLRFPSGEASFQLANALDSQTRVPECDAVIMNPPWGLKRGDGDGLLGKEGFKVARGQYDSWAIFVEWIISNSKFGTIVAAILPDALFSPEHEPIRRLLLEKTDIKLLARLGEGWFTQVFRSTVVVVFQVGMPLSPSLELIRIDHSARDRVKAARSTLADEARRATKMISPKRWLENPRAEFSLASTRGEDQLVQRMNLFQSDWAGHFLVGRGVEIGAKGILQKCLKCGVHRGPARGVLTCQSCGQNEKWKEVAAIHSEPVESSVPLIIGRDVKRFTAKSSRWLVTDLLGVQYKDPGIYSRPKVLVRKTGLGINAAVDESGAHTNQVVFHYALPETTPTWMAYYLVGVLNSSIMLAYHLIQSGETEWRSHPYITPKVLATLPVPWPEDDPESLAQAYKIAKITKLRSKALGEVEINKLENELNNFIAGMYNLTRQECLAASEALKKTQALTAFKHLHTRSNIIEPRKV